MAHSFHSSILREYDMRGVYGETVTEADAYALGRAYAVYLDKPGGNVCVGYDGRVHSPMLEDALIRGLTESGLNVWRVGLGPTPMLYYAVFTEHADGGIMITASHNPAPHNGFKLMAGKSSVFGQEIQKIGQIATSGKTLTGSGEVKDIDVKPRYLAMLKDTYKAGKPLTVAWDPGNGSAGALTVRLAEMLPGNHHVINGEIDGTFPAHHPDPTVAKNLQQLIALVQERKADVGIAFDGDGDRIGIVDDEGVIIWGDQLIGIYASEVLKERPGATIIADVKASNTLFAEIDRMGGNGLMWKTGHSLVKTKMIETKAPLAGEMSGHIFFADHYFGFDDGLYAAVRLLNLLAESGRKLSDWRKDFPQTFATPEYRVEVEEARKFAIVEEIAKALKDHGLSYNTVDGVRYETDEGWWLIRASNTQSAITMRVEGISEHALEHLKAHLSGFLEARGVRFNF